MFKVDSRCKLSSQPPWTAIPVRNGGLELQNTHVRVDAMKERRMAKEQRIEPLKFVIVNGIRENNKREKNPCRIEK